MSKNRKSRLAKIRAAQADLESSLLTLKDHFHVGWTPKSFSNLYYLIALAKKAP